MEYGELKGANSQVELFSSSVIGSKSAGSNPMLQVQSSNPWMALKTMVIQQDLSILDNIDKAKKAIKPWPQKVSGFKGGLTQKGTMES